MIRAFGAIVLTRPSLCRPKGSAACEPFRHLAEGDDMDAFSGDRRRLDGLCLLLLNRSQAFLRYRFQLVLHRGIDNEP